MRYLTALTVAAVLLAAPTVAEAEPLPLHSIWVTSTPMHLPSSAAHATPQR